MLSEGVLVERRKKQEEIDFSDRRKNMAQCPNHEELSGRMAKVEKDAGISLSKATTQERQISDLYDKHNAFVEVNTAILERLTAMELNQKTYMSQLSDFIKDFKERNFDQRIKDLEDFSWFRDKMTTLRDNLPWAFFTVILLIILFLLVAQDVSFGKLCRFLGIGGK